MSDPTAEILAALDQLKQQYGIGAVARALGEADNHHNAAVCPYCMHNGELIMVRRAVVDVINQAIADGELRTTQPTLRALRELLAARHTT